MRTSPVRPFHPIYPFPFFLPPPFFGAEKPLACDRPVVRATAHRPAAAVPPRTHDAGPAGVGTTNRLFGYLLPADDTATYETRVNRRGCDAEETRQNTKLLHRGTPSVRPRGPCAHTLVNTLVIRYYLPLACLKSGGGGGILSALEHTLPTCW